MNNSFSNTQKKMKKECHCTVCKQVYVSMVTSPNEWTVLEKAEIPQINKQKSAVLNSSRHLRDGLMVKRSTLVLSPVGTDFEVVKTGSDGSIAKRSVWLSRVLEDGHYKGLTRVTVGVVMVTYPNEWNSLEWDEKTQTSKQSINASSYFSYLYIFQECSSSVQKSTIS